MTSRRTGVEHVLTTDNEPISPHIQTVNVTGEGGNTHDKLHDMSSHTDRHKGADIASAAVITFGTDGDYFHITGTVKITSIVVRPPGDRVLIRIISPGLIVEHKTGTLNMRGGIDILSQSGTISEFVSEGSGEWTEIRRDGAEDGLNQAFEVPDIVAVAPPALVDSTSTGTGTSGVITTIITAVAPPALVDATSTATGTSGVTSITITAVAPPAPVVSVAVT